MSPFSRRNIILAALLISWARAQTASPTPSGPPASHSHAPAASSHPQGIVTLDQFVTSASPLPRNQVDLAQATTILTGRPLLLKQQATLGETLASETGITATSFGAGASRPIIRGLGGDRIRLLENSIGTLDASVTSPDHAVSVEPFLVDRIEILRGPASLLYGSNAVGGVVNVITHRIETDLPTQPVRGSFEVRGNSAADEFARGGVLDAGFKLSPDRAIIVHVDAFRRTTSDLKIPGFAESARIRAEETEHALEEGRPRPAFAHGRLPNSATDSDSGAVGVSFVSPALHLGASYSGFNSLYGVPGHAHEAAPGEAAGVRIDLRQRRGDVQGEWHRDAGLLRGARFKFGHADYRHAEIEPDGEVGTRFNNRGFDARFELLHGEDTPWTGSVGVQASRNDFGASGEEAFLPSSMTQREAAFAFQELARGAVTWQAGGRIERARVTPDGARARSDIELSGSVGAVWKLDAAHNLALSLTHTDRAPNAQELFAFGPHSGTQTFEIGSTDLDPERSLGAELSLRRRTGFVTGAVTLFTNRFNGYIFEQPTGLFAVEHDAEWEFLPADDEEVAEHGGLPVYRYVQRDARFWGAELETIWHLHEHRDWHLDLRLAGDLTRAREGGRNLPRIPAARTSAGLVWGNAVWSIGAETQFVFDQTRVAPNETTTDGYTLVSAHISRAFTHGRMNWEVFVRGTNLANKEVRPHTSFVKEVAPLAGQNFTAGVRLTF